MAINFQVYFLLLVGDCSEGELYPLIFWVTFCCLLETVKEDCGHQFSGLPSVAFWGVLRRTVAINLQVYFLLLVGECEGGLWSLIFRATFCCLLGSVKEDCSH